jgi:cell division protein FtsB
MKSEDTITEQLNAQKQEIIELSKRVKELEERINNINDHLIEEYLS